MYERDDFPCYKVPEWGDDDPRFDRGAAVNANDRLPARQEDDAAVVVGLGGPRRRDHRHEQRERRGSTTPSHTSIEFSWLGRHMGRGCSILEIEPGAETGLLGWSTHGDPQ